MKRKRKYPLNVSGVTPDDFNPKINLKKVTKEIWMPDAIGRGHVLLIRERVATKE